jgi:DNA polymerase III subunit epsilon
MTVLATRRQRVLYRARELWNKGFRAFDTETTGLESEDQIIQWAVVDQYGNVLGSGYVNPTVEVSAGAFRQHGISQEQLVDAPQFGEIWPVLNALLAGKTVAIYNAHFDVGKVYGSLRACDAKLPPYKWIESICIMELFAEFYGETHEYYGTYTWQSLNDVAVPHLQLEVPGQAHDAVHDAVATAMIVKKLAELADRELPIGWHPPVDVRCSGCGRETRECAEADEVWYCRDCSLERGLFHHCPGCNRIVEVPLTGYICDDLCEYCHKALHQEKMLLIGAWHCCPSPSHSYRYQIVETPDLDQLCKDCQRQLDWRRKIEEENRLREERLQQQRKEARREYAKEYRKRVKERERTNAERAAAGLPPLETEKKPEPDAIINHHGHQFRRSQDDQGRPEYLCIRCEAIWSRPPQAHCAGIKTYRAWIFIPDHLATRTQLLKAGLKPVKGQKPEAVMSGSFDSYDLYDRAKCVSVRRRSSGAGEESGSVQAQ